VRPSEETGDKDDDIDDCLASMYPTKTRDEDDEEYQGLLSDVDEDVYNLQATGATHSTSGTNENELREGDKNLDFARKPTEE